MSVVFADSSAIVKLDVEEEGHESVRAVSTLAVGQLTRMEVPAAFWRKRRLGELGAEDAQVLVAAFEADYFGTALTAGILDDAALRSARHPLRGFDPVQLASALAVRTLDPAVATMAVYDRALRGAPAAEGFAVL